MKMVAWTMQGKEQSQGEECTSEFGTNIETKQYKQPSFSTLKTMLSNISKTLTIPTFKAHNTCHIKICNFYFEQLNIYQSTFHQVTYGMEHDTPFISYNTYRILRVH
jgi:hypothetical protein